MQCSITSPTVVRALSIHILFIHLCAIADFLTCHEILIGRELKENRLKGVIVNLAFLIQDGFIRIGCEDIADEVVKVLQFVVAIHIVVSNIFLSPVS